MTWQIKDEWIDLAQAKHTVIFHNPEILVTMVPGEKPVPLEHHLIHDLRTPTCPHCGGFKPQRSPAPRLAWDDEGPPAEPEKIDFAALKKQRHEELNAQHKALVAYRGQHPHARIGEGPKRENKA